MRSGDLARLWASLALAALVMLPGAAAGARGGGGADLVILNGRIYAADGKPGFKEAVAVRGRKIVFVGTDADAKRYVRSSTKVIDANGHSVIPGLIDNHVHLLSGGEALEGPAFGGVRDAAALKRAIDSFLDANPDVTWIRGGGLYGQFTAKDLDPLTRGKPALLMAGDGHSMIANSAAMKLAGITRETPAPAGGEISKDPATGEPNGVFMETAQAVIERAIPPRTDADMERLLQKATDEALRNGVTTIVNVAHPAELTVYAKARREGRLRVRLYNAIWLTANPPAGGRSGLGFPAEFAFSEKDADDFDRLRSSYPNDDRLQLRMVKIMSDGVIESHTASMLQPYEDQSNLGVPNYTPEDLTRVITMMDRRGWQIMTHALGDRAVRTALDAYETAAKSNKPPPGGRRHKIEHMESMDPADIPRFGQLGVIASFQLAHASPMVGPGRDAERWRYLGYLRSAWGFPWKSINEAGGRVVFGSDWPVVSLNPGRAMHVGMNRMLNPPVPDQRLTMAEIIDGYTRDGAYAVYQEHKLGTIEVGKTADLVLLSDDIFAHPPVGSMGVNMTILDGEVVYEKTRQ